jgi:hypothetical protein
MQFNVSLEKVMPGGGGCNSRRGWKDSGKQVGGSYLYSWCSFFVVMYKAAGALG